MYIAICEPNPALRNELVRLVQQGQPDATVFAFSAGETFLAARERFAVCFLDIRGISGLEVAKALRERQERRHEPRSVIVFTTGYREHMEEAFDVQAFHYLVKPIDPERFRQVLARAVAETGRAAPPKEAHYLLRDGSTWHKLALRDILYAESDNKKVRVHTATGTHEAYGKMEALEAAWGPSFYRCHRCYLVNLAAIAAYAPGSVRLTNGETLLLAQKKYPAFVKTYLRYAREGGAVNV